MAAMTVFAENVAVWDKVMLGESLEDGEETRLAILLYNLLITDSENWYLQYNAGYLEEQLWESRLAILAPLTQLPIYEPWKLTLGARNHSASFLELLEDASRSGAVE